MPVSTKVFKRARWTVPRLSQRNILYHRMHWRCMQAPKTQCDLNFRDRFTMMAVLILVVFYLYHLVLVKPKQPAWVSERIMFYENVLNSTKQMSVLKYGTLWVFIAKFAYRSGSRLDGCCHHCWTCIEGRCCMKFQETEKTQFVHSFPWQVEIHAAWRNPLFLSLPGKPWVV